MGSLRPLFLRTAGMAALGTLAACGGGGVNSTPAPPTSVAPTPTPTPAAAPAPTPSPTPSATNYDTAEYRATVGAVSMNALAAYQKSATGAGITVGVIDTGIDLQSAEFTGRVSSASASVAGNADIDDVDGHGSAVAFTIAGRRNGSGSQGVAFDSTLLIARADTPNTCNGSTGEETECSFNDDNIARGVDLARQAGARVINISLGGDDPASRALVAAVDRATAAGVVIVIAAGNDSGANPEASALFANNDAVARGLVIIAGSVGSTDTISTFSNKAGTGATHYLTAVGERVRAPDNNNSVYLWSGTSFATPQIAGAVALLAQAFPNLSGAQIVSLLYQTARDAGTAGVDSVYGQGILDLTRAFQPLGATVMAGGTAGVSTVGNAVLSAPMGDARSGTLGTVMLDSYRRAFATDLSSTVARAAPDRPLAAALQPSLRQVSFANGGTTAWVSVSPNATRPAPMRLSAHDAAAASALAGSVVQRLGRTLSFGLGFSQGMGALTGTLAGRAQPAFLVARDDGLGFTSAARASSAMRQAFGRLGVTAGIETGEVRAWRDPLLAGLSGWRRARYDRAAFSLDRRLGRLSTIFSATWLAEHGTVLGAQFDPSLGAARSTSWFADAAARWSTARGWTVGGSIRRGWTGASGAIGGGTLVTGAWAADVGKDGVLGGDSLGLRFSQPLRVARGGLDLTLPTGWDYATLSVSSWTTQRMNLAPTGRELDAELRYAVALAGGRLDTNLYWRRDPGNVADLPDDRGAALRWSRAF